MLTEIVPPVKAAELYYADPSQPPADILYSAMRQVGAVRAYTRDEEVYGEGEQSSKVFFVIDGAMRICRFRDDGQRQIEAFYLPGEFFGFDIDRERRFTAEVTTNSILLVADAATLLTLEARSEGLVRALWRSAVEDLRRSQDHSLLLGCRNAHERILTFLGEMAHRSKRSASIDLPMSRQDMADYLGLTIETVSRTLTDLARRAEIDLPRPRRVILRKPNAGCRTNAHAERAASS